MKNSSYVKSHLQHSQFGFQIKLFINCMSTGKGYNIIKKTFKISIMFAKDFIASHSLSSSPIIPRVNNLILIVQSFSRT